MPAVPLFDNFGRRLSVQYGLHRWAAELESHGTQLASPHQQTAFAQKPLVKGRPDGIRDALAVLQFPNDSGYGIIVKAESPKI